MNQRLSQLHVRYAVLLLAVTLLAGVYLRAAFIWPAVRGGIPTPHMIHAHSHAGFFGWMVMAAAGALLLRVAPVSVWHVRAHIVLAHCLGLASLAAFLGFALRGYDVATITLSALHVVFWMVLAALLWRPLRDTPNADSHGLLRGGLAFLVGAGAATIVPGVMMAQQVSDPWLVQFGVKLFLTPFVSGFLLLTALGLVYSRVRNVTQATTVFLLIAVGTLPSTFLYVPGPPAEWMTLAGRLGIALVGAGLLLFAGDMLAIRLKGGRTADGLHLTSPAGLVVLSAAAAAVIKLLAAAGVGASFMHNRSLVIAVLHLVLLGVVTPAFVQAVAPRVVMPVRSAVYAAGLALLLLPLVAMGWPWATRLLMLRGVSTDALLSASAVGGMIAAVALLALCVRPDRSAAPAAVSADHATAGTAVVRLAARN
jgi:hypothetical protein